MPKRISLTMVNNTLAPTTPRDAYRWLISTGTLRKVRPFILLESTCPWIMIRRRNLWEDYYSLHFH